jgi:hypothetical protein
LWLLDAVLQAQPASFTGEWWRSDLAQSVMGQPAVINRSIFSVVHLIAAHAAICNSAVVAMQAVLGAALIVGRFERIAIIVSIPWAVGIWWVGEGFGTLPTGFAMAGAGAPGPVVLYPLIGLLAWPQQPYPATPAGPAPADSPSTIRGRSGATAWVVLWAGQALLQIPWTFPARQVLVANVEEYSAGQPGWLGAVAHQTESLARHHPLGLTAALIVAQVAVGVGVLFPTTRRSALAAGIVVSVVYWFAFQYLGGIAAGHATDPGTAPLMILLACGLWPPPSRRGTLRRALQQSSEGASSSELRAWSSISRPTSAEPTGCAGMT